MVQAVTDARLFGLVKVAFSCNRAARRLQRHVTHKLLSGPHGQLGENNYRPEWRRGAQRDLGTEVFPDPQVNKAEAIQWLGIP
jgi:hypothetical protein